MLRSTAWAKPLSCLEELARPAGSPVQACVAIAIPGMVLLSFGAVFRFDWVVLFGAFLAVPLALCFGVGKLGEVPARTRAVFLCLCALLVPSALGDKLDLLLRYSVTDPRPPGTGAPDFSLRIHRLRWTDEGKLEAEFVITKETPGAGGCSSPGGYQWVGLEWRFYSRAGMIYNRRLATVCFHSEAYFCGVATTDILLCSVVPPPGAVRCRLCYGTKLWATPTVPIPARRP